MANLLEGLFGLRPNLESQQETMQTNRGMGFGELLGRAGVNPYAPKAVQDAYLGRQAAQGALVGKAANTVAGLFGMETPELQRAKGMESILQQTQADTDLNNPAEFYPTLARRMAEAGFTQEALQIGQVGAKVIQDTQLNTAKIRSESASASKDVLTGRTAQYNALPSIVKLSQAQSEATEAGDTKLASDIGLEINKLRSANEQQALAEGLTPQTPEYTRRLQELSNTGDDALSMNKAIAKAQSDARNPNLPIEVRQAATQRFNDLVAANPNAAGSSYQMEMPGQPNSASGQPISGGDVATGPGMVNLRGSKAEKAEEVENRKYLSSQIYAIESMDNALASVSDAQKLIGPGTTGWNAILKLPGSNTLALDGFVQAIKSPSVINNIRNMKEQSSTGATGFGALNKEELRVLETIIAELDPKASPEILAKNIDKFYKVYNRGKKRGISNYQRVTGKQYMSYDKRFGIFKGADTKYTSDQSKALKRITTEVNKGTLTQERAIDLLNNSSEFDGIPVSLQIEEF